MLAEKIDGVFDLARKGEAKRQFNGFVVFEPHADAIPHAHVFIVGTAPAMAWMREEFESRFVGKREIAFSDPEKISAVEFVDYLSKTLIEGEDKMAADAWASDAGIRQFRWKGIKKGFVRGWEKYAAEIQLRVNMRYSRKPGSKQKEITVADLQLECFVSLGRWRGSRKREV